MTPRMWALDIEDALNIARSPKGPAPTPLLDDLRAALQSRRPRVRETAVLELAEILESTDQAESEAARGLLADVAGNDVPLVAETARRVLGVPGKTESPSEEPHDESHDGPATLSSRNPRTSQNRCRPNNSLSRRQRLPMPASR